MRTLFQLREQMTIIASLVRLFAVGVQSNLSFDDRDIIDVKTPLDELIQEIDKNLNEINALEEKVDMIDGCLPTYEYDHCQIGDVKSVYWNFQFTLEAIKKEAIAYKKKLNK